MEIDLPQFVTVEWLTQQLGITRQQLYRWRTRGLPHIKIGSKVLFHGPAVAQWLKKQEVARLVEEDS